MSSFLKIILGVFISLVIVFSGIGILGANNDANAASSYIQYVSNEIALSNFSQDVIDALVLEAKTEPNNYELSVEKKGMDAAGNCKYAEVELTYTYSIKILGVESQHTLKQIAK